MMREIVLCLMHAGAAIPLLAVVYIQTLFNLPILFQATLCCLSGFALALICFSLSLSIRYSMRLRQVEEFKLSRVRTDTFKPKTAAAPAA